MIATNPAGATLEPDVKAALHAYLEALTLAEPVLARLWQEAEITLNQLAVLRELRQGPQSAGRLGEKLGLSPASLTRLVDRLERRGLVSRRRESEDRRYVDVHLEPEGERLLGEIRVLRGSDVHRAVEAMSAADRKRLTSSLARLVAAARSAGATEEPQ